MKIIRCATIGMSLNIFCNGVLRELKDQGYDVVALSSPDEDLNELAWREGVRSIGVSMARHVSLWQDIMSLRRLVKIFRRERPDMVHSITPKAGLLCMMAAWMAKVPVRIHTFTGLVWPTSTGMTRKVLMLTDKITCACATHVIPEGQGVMNDLAAHITQKPMKVLGYGNIRGIDLSYWTKGQVGTLAAEDKVLTFLFVGRLVGDKGINELIAAMSSLINDKSQLSEKPCRLVLVGAYEDELDPIKPETREMIDKMPEIVWAGPMYGDDLRACYASADCFVFPSYREGFPNTVIEAGAMELPCIVTDINGCNEIIVDSGSKIQVSGSKIQGASDLHICPNGIIIPSKNVEAIKEAMVWMLEHEEERKLMGQKGRQMVSERFEQGFVRQQLYDFYRTVLKES